MAKPILAYIIPVDSGAHPEHPIAPGGPGEPPGIWGGAGSLPPWVMPPIAPGGRPPGIWGGGNEPFPTPPIVILPPGTLHPEHPIVIVPPPSGNRPMPPIYIPPDIGIWPPDARPEHPIFIPPPTPTEPPTPTHPIVLPPGVDGEPPKPEVLANWEVKTFWTPQGGWGVAVVPTPEHPGVPTPSKAQQGAAGRKIP